MQNKQNVLDFENMVRAAKYPLIAVGALILFVILRVSLGYLFGIVYILLEAFAGGIYMNTIIHNGKFTSLINAGINGGIMSAAVILIYEIISWIVLSIIYKSWSFDFLALLTTLIEAALVGFMGAISWYSLKNDLGK